MAEHVQMQTCGHHTCPVLGIHLLLHELCIDPSTLNPKPSTLNPKTINSKRLHLKT